MSLPAPAWSRPVVERGKEAAPPRAPLHIVLAVVSVVFALGVVGVGAMGLLSLLAREDVSHSREFATSPRRLDVLVDGRLTLSPSPDGRVHVRQRSSYSFRPPEVTEFVSADTLTLQARCGWWPGSCGIDYDVEVPVGALAEVYAESVTGDIDARGLRGGRIDADSSSGTVALSFDVAPERVTATTSSGDVVVRVPPGVEAYRVETGGVRRLRPSPGGSWRSGTNTDEVQVRVREDSASDRLIEATTASGTVTVDYR